MPLETPSPDDVLELFRDEIVPREADVDGEYDEAVKSEGLPAWVNPFPNIETLTTKDGVTVMRVSYRRLLDGAYDEGDRVRHELRDLWNDIRASVSSESQVEFVSPRMTHVDRPEGLEVVCYTHGVVRTS